MHKQKISVEIVSIVAHVLFIILALGPLYATLIISLTPDSELLKAQVYPMFLELSNFYIAFIFIIRNVLNSFFYAIATTLVVAIISIPAAYVLARYRFKGKQTILFLILITQMMAGIVILPTLYSQFNRFGLVNRASTLIFVLSSVNLALSIWLLYGYFKTLPDAIEDAAQLDGVNYINLLVKVILPISGPGVAVSSIFVFVIHIIKL